jgi:hypothetical protein
VYKEKMEEDKKIMKEKRKKKRVIMKKWGLHPHIPRQKHLPRMRSGLSEPTGRLIKSLECSEKEQSTDNRRFLISFLLR